MTIEWKAVKEEAIGILREYITIDTTNPPGLEKPAADFLENILKKDGLKTETYQAVSERPNLICHLKGDGSKKALILLHHMDVVPVEREKWSVDPFDGRIQNGFLWGRGALDMKGTGIIYLMAFLLAHRLSLPLKRDLIYLAVPDEETGGEMGAEWLTNNHPDKIEAEYLINEGGTGWKEGPLSGFNVGIGEKGPLWLRLSVDGTPGHGSVPVDDNACVRLAKALTRIADFKTPLQIVPEMHTFLDRVGTGRDISPGELADHDLLKRPIVAAMFRNTISLTGLKAGQKENVIPSRAEATFDCRLLPGADHSSFIKELEEIIADEGIQIDVIMQIEASCSPAETEIYSVLEGILAENYPEVLVLPTISTGFTDSRCFRRLGTHCYGLLPLLIDLEIIGTIHGHDERLPIHDLEKGIKVIFDMIKGLNT
jgi:acetylornithine deacetylase/succinyl-diaminopimelate desuccinylase-like protein